MNELLKIGDYENVIYSCVVNGKERILRMTEKHHRSQIMLEAEIEWLNFLKGSDVSVAAPIKIVDNEFIIPIHVDGATLFAVMLAKAPGKHVRASDWSNTLIKQLGTEIGKLHRCSIDFIPAQQKRHDWETEYPMESAGSQDLRKLKMETLRQIVRTDRKPENYGLTHGDINFGNFKIDDGSPTFFDFDDSSYCWFVRDIAVLLVESINLFCVDENPLDFTSNFLQHFCDGYELCHHIDDEMMRLLPSFAKLRELQLFEALQELSLTEYYDHEKRFMVNREAKIREGVPFLELP